MFGFSFDKPASPQTKAARDFIKRNQSRFDNLKSLNDGELAELERETESLLTDEQRWHMYDVGSEVRDVYLGATESLKAERWRRASERSDAYFRRSNSVAAVTASLSWLLSHATGAESIETAKELGLTADDVLGTEPPTVAKVGRAAAAKMTDEELEGAMRAAREQWAATAPFVLEADAIQAALDYLAPLVRELKRRQSLLASCRKRGEENYRVLELEQSERNASRAASAAKLEELTSDTPTAIAQILKRLDAIEGAS